jgi:hypothetical protein
MAVVSPIPTDCYLLMHSLKSLLVTASLVPDYGRFLGFNLIAYLFLFALFWSFGLFWLLLI